MVILSACQGSLDDKPNYHYNHKEANHTPGVPAERECDIVDGKRNLSGDFVVAPVSKKKEEERYKQQLFSGLQLLGYIYMYKVIHSIRPMKTVPVLRVL